MPAHPGHHPGGVLAPLRWGDRSIDQSIAIGAEDFHTALLAELAANPGQVVVYGTSQGGAVMSLEKRRLADLPQPDKDRLVFVITGNPNRPNGGLLERFTPLSVPGLDFTFNGATPTNTGIKTVDIAFQYDVIADFPRYPLNPLVWLNMAAAESIHSSYLTSTDGYTEARTGAGHQRPGEPADLRGHRLYHHPDQDPAPRRPDPQLGNRARLEHYYQAACRPARALAEGADRTEL